VNILKSIAGRALCVVCAFVLVACAAPAPRDDSLFKAANPASILILPPLNASPDVDATNAVFAALTQPLSERGYYVFPVALVRETFEQNGLSQAADIHDLPLEKINAIFGADAVMYVTINEYGASIGRLGEVVVSAQASLKSTRTGQTIWSHGASASSAEGQNNQGTGALGLLLTAVIKQIVNTVTDSAYPVATVMTGRLASDIVAGPRLKAAQEKAGQ
jgi:hypothetical protein